MINLKLSNYGRIGNSPLIQAIGIQKNHKQFIYTETQELDRVASGCFSCENYQNHIEFLEYMPDEVQHCAQKRCDNCPSSVYKTITHESYKYINEKNQFGNAPRLKSIAIKLLLIYHFSFPDENGLIKNLLPKELARYLGCTVRSIKNANETLQSYGYIMYTNSGYKKHSFHVILSEYSAYALPSNKGGRGYATFNLECLNELVKIKDLNQLRIFLRIALELDTKKRPENDLVVSPDYDSLRLFLPYYCKPGIIKKALSSISDLFAAHCYENNITLQMNPIFHGRRNYEQNNIKNTSLMEEYIAKLDNAINKTNKNIVANTIDKIPIDKTAIEFLSSEGIISRRGNKKFFVAFDLTKEDLSDLGRLCTTYTFDAVKECIAYIYENYHSTFKLNSIGALIRTILKEKFSFPNIISPIHTNSI